MEKAAFQSLVDIMIEERPPRVWSLLVTVFGELAQDSRAGVSGATLGHLTEAIGIKPEAMRVALHRLRRDGWIESVKSGRASNHRLSERGRSESAKANPAIYLQLTVPERVWFVIRRQPDSEERGAAELALGQCLSIAVEEVACPKALCLPLFEDSHIPEWVTGKLCDAELQAQSAQLEAKLDRLSTALKAEVMPTPLQIAVLRVLIIHEWRRLVLKAPNLPGYLFPRGWRGRQCRSHLEDLLKTLDVQKIDTIERDIAA